MEFFFKLKHGKHIVLIKLVAFEHFYQNGKSYWHKHLNFIQISFNSKFEIKIMDLIICWMIKMRVKFEQNNLFTS